MSAPHTFTQPLRHPELVSGSIVPLAPMAQRARSGAVGLPNDTSVCVAKWTLEAKLNLFKQVQGDGATCVGETAHV
ncbi:MAG: hypothetical protein KA233_02525 [Novosphingobium sp.]|nr:hypothetical protein [Novosphingobium sp.]